MDSPEARPLRYAAACSRCGAVLPPRTRAAWNKERREATCTTCLSQPSISPTGTVAIDRGIPGASAALEGRRRRAKRESQINAAHPRIGKLILALTDEPQSTRAWEKGAAGEQWLGSQLDGLRSEGFGVLHDRRIPGTRANVDHLVIGSAGVFVIDAKHYKGLVERRDRGWIFERDWRLYVNGRDKSKLLEGMAAQVKAVRAALAATLFADVTVCPVLCFTDSDWGLLASPFSIGEVYVTWPRALAKMLRGDAGPLGPDGIAALELELATSLPAAHTS
jgi:hypothetical protein